MDLRFYIDPETGEPHIHLHGVTEQEVEEVLRTTKDDVRGRKRTRYALGRTEAGRMLKVVYLPEPYWNQRFVITAYEIRGRQLAAARRRRRKK